MEKKRSTILLASFVLVVGLVVLALSACSSSSPSASPAASSSASTKASTSPAASAASPSASPSASSPAASPSSAADQAYQKALASWKQVTDAAQKEGEATIYSVWDADTLKKLEEAFNKVDPKIQVKIVRMTGAVALERMKAEQATKQYVSNIYMGGSPANRPMAAAGLGQLVDDLPVMYDPSVKWIVPPLYDKPHETLTLALDRYFILANTNLVPADQMPKTWKDLADPKWKDKLVIWDPRMPSIGRAVLSTLSLNPAYGPDLARKIAENARVVPDPAQIPQLVVRGEMALGVDTWGDYLAVKDGPVKPISPSDGTISTPLQAVVAKTAPQINTTKVFLNWFLGKDGQKIMSMGYATLRPDVDAISKETQVATAQFLPNVPYTWDFEMTKMKELDKDIAAWLNEMGK